MRGKQVSDLGESALIDRIVAGIGKQTGAIVAAGDDAAVVPFESTELLLTIDELVEEVDFNFGYCSGADAGWKAIAVNASDIAAMCGRPLWSTVSLELPPHTDVSRVDQIVDGMSHAADRWGIGVVGGDISRGHKMSITVAMAGCLAGESAVRRSGARVGDALLVTGSLGGAAAGLTLLGMQDEKGNGHISSADKARSSEPERRLIQRQLRPEARVEPAAALAGLQPSSMIDLSDGLATDLDRLMISSGTGCTVDPPALPLDPDLEALFGTDREAAFELALVGGEDFELLFTIDPQRVGRAVDAVQGTGVPCTRIGTVTEGECLVGSRALEEWKGRGWDHLRSP
jgi:thiamine-monophosphate kinase